MLLFKRDKINKLSIMFMYRLKNAPRFQLASCSSAEFTWRLLVQTSWHTGLCEIKYVFNLNLSRMTGH